MATIVAASGGGSWSATGTWVGGVVPTASDDVQLNASSGNVTITGSAANCRSLDCTGYVGTLAFNNTLNIGTSTAGPSNLALKFVAGMTLTVSGGVLVLAGSYTTTAQTVDLGGKIVGQVNASGAGSFQLVSTFGSTTTVTHTNGTLDLNGQTVNCTTLSSTGVTARTLTMGAASVNLTAAGGFTVSGSNVTVNSGTSTITMSSTGATFAGGGFTYYNLVFSGAVVSPTISGANTFNNLSATGSASKTNLFTFGASQTVNGTLTLNGTSAINRLLVQSATLGTTVTLTCAAVAMTYVDLQDIAGAGAASWDLHAITGLSGDCGGNSGITFTAPTTQTATGTASFAWSTHGWTTHVPLPQDTVSIPNAFIATRVVTCDMPRLGKDITFSCTGNPQIATSSATVIYGNLTLASGMTSSGASAVSFSGRGSQTITTAGVSLTHLPNINSAGGTYQVQDNFTTSGSGTLTSGTLDLNGKVVTCSTLSNVGALARSINYNSGTLSLTATSGTPLSASGSGYTTVDTGTISIATASTSTRTFAGGGFTYPILSYIVAGSTGLLTITGANTFAGINFSDASNARTLAFTGATTTTFTTFFNVQGTSGNLMTIDSVGGVTPHTLSMASGIVNCDYLVVARSHAGGGATWYAGANSTNFASNTGWIFTAAPPLTNVQGAVARIAITETNAQGALARIANNRTKNQGAVARIKMTVNKLQTAVSRIANNRPLTQPSTSRIANNRTKTQGATANIIQTAVHNQPAVSRIAINATKPQGALARIAKIVNKLQAAAARVANTLTSSQTSAARIANNETNQQTAASRIAITATAPQAAAARISETLATHQGATADIAARVTKGQGAKALIVQGTQITQGATAYIIAPYINQQGATALIIQVPFGAAATVNASVAPAVEITASVVPSVGIAVEVNTP